MNAPEPPGTPPLDFATTEVTTSDGLDLMCHCWRPDAPRGVLAIVHGLAEHGERYCATAEHFAAQGWAVHAVDLRGHGHSPGLRVHVESFADYDRDVTAMLELTADLPADLPRILLGHSMGGLIALRYVLDHPAEIAGAAISSPGLGTHPDLEPPFVVSLAARLLARLAPRTLFPSDLDATTISRDQDVVESYRADPLIGDKVSARWYTSVLAAMAEVNARAAELAVPVLLMQSGDDRLVDPEATRRWAAAAPPEWVELVVWKGLYHEMLNEPEKEDVRARLRTWMETHFPRPILKTENMPSQD